MTKDRGAGGNGKCIYCKKKSRAREKKQEAWRPETSSSISFPFFLHYVTICLGSASLVVWSGSRMISDISQAIENKHWRWQMFSTSNASKTFHADPECKPLLWRKLNSECIIHCWNASADTVTLIASSGFRYVFVFNRLERSLFQFALTHVVVRTTHVCMCRCFAVADRAWISVVSGPKAPHVRCFFLFLLLLIIIKSLYPLGCWCGFFVSERWHFVNTWISGNFYYIQTKSELGLAKKKVAADCFSDSWIENQFCLSDKERKLWFSEMKYGNNNIQT